MDQTLEEIIIEVEDLLEIKDDNLAHEAVKQVRIFPRLATLHMNHTRKLEKLNSQFEKVKHERWLRYMGKQTALHYKNEPMAVAILKGDVADYLKVDPQVIECKLLLSEQERIVKFLEDAKSQLKERAYLLRTALDFRRLTNGQ